MHLIASNLFYVFRFSCSDVIHFFFREPDRFVLDSDRLPFIVRKMAAKTPTTIAGDAADGGGEDSKRPVPDHKSAAIWSIEEVGLFIRSLNPAFGEYAKAFENDSVDGPMLVTAVDSEWLTATITNALHRKRIAGAIADLKRELPSIGLTAIPMAGRGESGGGAAHGPVLNPAPAANPVASRKRKSADAKLDPLAVDAHTGGGGDGDQKMSGSAADPARLHKRGRSDAAVPLVQTEALGPSARAVHTTTYNEIIQTGSNRSSDGNSNVYFVLKSTDWELKWLDGLNKVSTQIPRFSHHHHMFDDTELKSKWEYHVREEKLNCKLVCTALNSLKFVRCSLSLLLLL